MINQRDLSPLDANRNYEMILQLCLILFGTICRVGLFHKWRNNNFSCVYALWTTSNVYSYWHNILVILQNTFILNVGLLIYRQSTKLY